MTRILVVAPHPDDETLGCGGTLLQARDAGAHIFWLIVTNLTQHSNISPERITQRKREIKAVASHYKMRETLQLNFPTTTLDDIAIGDIISAMGDFVSHTQPNDIYLPFRRDAHSDHRVVFDAGVAVSKWFRYPSVKRVLAYETQSETDFDLAPDSIGFRPNVFVNISEYLEEKIKIASIYESEFSNHPFPRSKKGIDALATLRGAASGFKAAEAFMLLRERMPGHERNCDD